MKNMPYEKTMSTKMKNINKETSGEAGVSPQSGVPAPAEIAIGVELEEDRNLVVRFRRGGGEVEERRLSTDVTKLYWLPQGGYVIVAFEDFKVFYGSTLSHVLQAYLNWLFNEEVEIISWGWVRK
jgi:hypothetical protein